MLGGPKRQRLVQPQHLLALLLGGSPAGVAAGRAHVVCCCRGMAKGRQHSCHLCLLRLLLLLRQMLLQQQMLLHLLLLVRKGRLESKSSCRRLYRWLLPLPLPLPPLLLPLALLLLELLQLWQALGCQQQRVGCAAAKASRPPRRRPYVLLLQQVPQAAAGRRSC